MVKVSTKKKIITAAYILALLGFFLFPIYISELEPTVAGPAGAWERERSIVTDMYGYLWLLPRFIIFSAVYWMIFYIIILTSEQEERAKKRKRVNCCK